MEPDDLLETLMQLAGDANLALSEEQATLCCTHARLMLEWNRKVNLTRITEPREILIKHCLDSLIPARWLPHEGLALDVGTGPGFPGIPLRIASPELRMVLLEASRKKSSFLRVLLARLNLSGVTVVQDRWEEFPKRGASTGPEDYSLIVMRAVRLETEHLSGLASKVLRPGGVFAWWAGPGAQSEKFRESGLLQSGAMVFEGEFPYRLPSIESSHRLLVWRKKD
jgi:16S rRNA (guanine527-N7)-methyltransferase